MINCLEEVEFASKHLNFNDLKTEISNTLAEQKNYTNPFKRLYLWLKLKSF